MAITKKQFMVRLKRMIDHVKKTDGRLELYCPASKKVTVPFYVPSNRVNRTMCHICHKTMETNFCPCGDYEPNKALKLAQKKIKEYFR